LLLLAAPACLLYTDPINTAPRVVNMIAPATVFPGKSDIYRAEASDPDGDSVSVEWSVAEGKCQEIRAEDWAAAEASTGDTFSFTPANHDPFCVRVMARDRHGAPSAPRFFDGMPLNRPPAPVLTVDPPAGPASFPLYTAFRLTAGPLRDDDGDSLTFTWKGVDPQGADLAARLTACDPQHKEVRCLSAEQPGMYTISIEATDGVDAKAVSQSVTLAVLDDAPPCIEATDPVQETPVVVLAATDRRNFEVRRVRDDGNPFPAGPHGGTSFQWFTMRDDNTTTVSWTRHLGFDRPVFEVSTALFEDARPGSRYLVRVEARDPQHETGNDLRSCGETPICMVPDRCVRWVTWSVRFQ
jgi:hypothetical protein